MALILQRLMEVEVHPQPRRGFGLGRELIKELLVNNHFVSLANRGRRKPPASIKLELAPHHLIDDACIALDDLHYFGGDVFVDVVGDGDAVVAGGVHGDGGVDGLEQTVRIDAGDEEAGFIKGLRPFS